MHLPNGSFATFGGNGAVTVGGTLGSDPYPGNFSAIYDATYQDYDGTTAIRIVNPCNPGDDFSSSQCAWYDDPSVLSMQKHRWYSSAEPLADGTIAIIGGFVNGGYINRNYPNTDPDGPAAENTFEFFPANGRTATKMQFLIETSGLNSYSHTYLLASGKMLIQANISTSNSLFFCRLLYSHSPVIWDPNKNADDETRLPDMPGNVVRVYPGSGATAMLPLTPANNYIPTVLFCGGQDMPQEDWGDYSFPRCKHMACSGFEGLSTAYPRTC